MKLSFYRLLMWHWVPFTTHTFPFLYCSHSVFKDLLVCSYTLFTFSVPPMCGLRHRWCRILSITHEAELCRRILLRHQQPYGKCILSTKLCCRSDYFLPSAFAVVGTCALCTVSKVACLDKWPCICSSLEPTEYAWVSIDLDYILRLCCNFGMTLTQSMNLHLCAGVWIYWKVWNEIIILCALVACMFNTHVSTSSCIHRTI